MESFASPVRVPWARPFFGEEELAAVAACLRSGWVAMGARVRQLEERLEALLGCRHAVAVSSGTAALDIALKVLGIRPGDEVIVPAFGYVATANAVLYQHATPVFADVDPQTYTIDPEDVRKKMTDRTRCIIAIDYAGHPADYDRLRAMAQERELHLVEDGAPGLGGAYGGRSLCTLGDVSTTSFHSAKIFTTAEGGMVFTESDKLAELSRIVRSQGEDPERKYYHPVVGHNYRMTDLHAAIGLAQFDRVSAVLASRAEAATVYTELLSEIPGVILPTVHPGCRHAWFLFSILIPQRDVVRARMRADGIETNVSWPLPLYEQPIFRRFRREQCEVTERLCRNVLCLPLYYGITREAQGMAADSLRRALVNG